MTARHPLPDEVRQLVKSAATLRERFRGTGLKFTLDGNLVCDLGEAIAAEHFCLKLEVANAKGVDGTAKDGRTVQVKATGGDRGVAFTHTDVIPDHLLVLRMHFDDTEFEIVFDGPYSLIQSELPGDWSGQKTIRMKMLVELNEVVADEDRLPAV
jgi:hypothetical protein